MEKDTISLYDEFTDLYFNETLNYKEYEINEKIWTILREIKQQYQTQEIVFLSLYGSQNYNLDTENSDIDCQCFFFPTIDEIIFNKQFKSTTIHTPFGECVLKDIRYFFDELRKSSPNTLELLGTKFIIVNREYQLLLHNMANYIDTIARLNEYKLLKGYEGLYHRYVKEVNNNHNSKYYANTLRIMEIIDTITTLPEWEYQMLLIPSEVDYLKWVKTNDFDKVFRADYFDNKCFITEAALKNYFENHSATCVEFTLNLINQFQEQIMKKYLKLVT
jgi:predicted nucleotidyltransferase